eukprot:gb/GECH01008266.1/.p1 GENE.gb/GECH01008266.1/~~gb/GECH01008266.1/.p1  ORF type:complete len:102 (+),score=4.54 gb/GECH01008266.1/:1-306(+)
MKCDVLKPTNNVDCLIISPLTCVLSPTFFLFLFSFSPTSTNPLHEISLSLNPCPGRVYGADTDYTGTTALLLARASTPVYPDPRPMYPPHQYDTPHILLHK